MNLPEQELFSVEDVAARWKKSVSYVQDLVRRKKLPTNRGFIEHAPGSRSVRLRTYIVRKDLEAFEQAAGAQTGSWLDMKDAMKFHGRSDKQIRRWKEEKKIKWKRGPGNRLLFFCSHDL
jgi:hypothetical protein